MRSLATVVLLLAAVSASCSDQDSAAPDGAVVRDLLAEPDSRQQVVGDGWQVVLSVLVPEDRLPEPRLYVDGADVGDISIYEVREAVQSVDLIGDYAAVITFPGYGAGPGCVPVVVDQLGFAGDQLTLNPGRAPGCENSPELGQVFVVAFDRSVHTGPLG